MLKLQPILKDYIWGGTKLKRYFQRDNGQNTIAESWEVSVHPDGINNYGQGNLKEYLERLPSSVDKSGSDFAILIKYIDALQKLSVQVHPDDDYSRRVENDNGKTEMWYIVEADEGAGIYCGFKKSTDKAEFLQHLNNGNVEDLLNFIPVKAGDCYLIKAGTVHAICAGCLILEVQQSSNVTYRIYDYNRKDINGKERLLHLDKALDVITFECFNDETNSSDWKNISDGNIRKLTECEYFCCRELEINGHYTEINEDSFTTLNFVKGSGVINGKQFVAGDSFFVDCGEKFLIEGNALVILTNYPKTNK